MKLGELTAPAAAFALALLLATPASAAYIHVDTAGDGSVRIVIDGELAESDQVRFADLVADIEEATVVMKSPGGALLAGIDIGETIRKHGFATLVEDGEECASACGLAWLAGTPRLMAEGAQVGFHAAYIDDSGEMQTSAPANALVGAYVNELGFSTSVVVYVTDAMPDDMRWLTLEDAEDVGIDVTHVARAAPAEDAAKSGASRLTRAAIAAVESYFAASSEENPDAIRFLHRAYAPKVDYYGKETTRDAIIFDKISFVRRWPERRYTLRPDTLMAECADADACIVAGIYDWWAYSADRDSTSVGAAEFRFVFSDLSPLTVTAEDSTVIARRVEEGRIAELTAE